MSLQPQYEFTEAQNSQVSSLASKMGFVGFFSVVFGVLGLLITLVVVLTALRDRLPADVKKQIQDTIEKANNAIKDNAKSDTAKEKIEQYSPKELPANNQLWAIAGYVGVTSLFFLLLGVWTRTSAVSFQKIVDTKGSDITNLMNALDSLASMYALIYLLLVIALLASLALVGLALYGYFTSM